MKENFIPTLTGFTLPYEGGKVDNPRDPGGRTNQGVTQRVYDNYLRGLHLPTRDVYKMTATERNDIYKNQYWDKVHGDVLAAGVDAVTFDAGVMSGPSRALKWLYASVGGDDVTTIKKICRARLGFVQSLKALFRTFGKGWTRRIVACEAFGVAMAIRAAHASLPSNVQPVVAPPKKILQGEVTDALHESAKDGNKATATGAGGSAATIGGATIGDETYLYIGLAVGVVVIIIACVYLWRSRVNNLRAEAYAAQAQEH